MLAEARILGGDHGAHEMRRDALDRHPLTLQRGAVRAVHHVERAAHGQDRMAQRPQMAGQPDRAQAEPDPRADLPPRGLHRAGTTRRPLNDSEPSGLDRLSTSAPSPSATRTPGSVARAQSRVIASPVLTTRR